MNSYLVISNIKQLAIECELVLLNISLGSDGIEVTLLSVIHVRPVTKVLLDKPLVVPGHFFPGEGYIRILSELFAFICF